MANFSIITLVAIGAVVRLDVIGFLVAGLLALGLALGCLRLFVHSHASDRFPGKYDHSVIGEGSVDFDQIFACLACIGYDGYISLEDNNPEGHSGTGRAVAFIRRKVAEHWGA